MPSTSYHRSFRRSMLEWDGAHQDGAGIRDPEVLAGKQGFDLWVEQLLAEETVPARPGFVTCTYRWMVEDSEYVGSIALRHELNDNLLVIGGHVGYGVRPTARGRGLAAQALRQVLPLANARGLSEVLLTCDARNVASRRTIERAGGRREGEAHHDGRTVQRWWITTGRA